MLLAYEKGQGFQSCPLNSSIERCKL